jgi:hypothetical protein
LREISTDDKVAAVISVPKEGGEMNIYCAY